MKQGAKDNITTKGIGTVVGRKSVVNKKEYMRFWIYIPQKLAEDSQFPFQAGDPAEIEVDVKEKRLIISQLPIDEAMKKGWNTRIRKD